MDVILFKVVPLYIFLFTIFFDIFFTWIFVGTIFKGLKYLGFDYEKRKKRLILWVAMSAVVQIQTFLYMQYSLYLSWVTVN
jgi:hypothetical protein